MVLSLFDRGGTLNPESSVLCRIRLGALPRCLRTGWAALLEIGHETSCRSFLQSP